MPCSSHWLIKGKETSEWHIGGLFKHNHLLQILNLLKDLLSGTRMADNMELPLNSVTST